MQSNRCIHRHTIKTHPLCFRQKQWYDYDNIRIGYLDIEVSNLAADQGFMLSWCIKPRNSNNYIFRYLNEFDRIYKNWREWDKFLVVDLISYMETFDLLITYNGCIFDLPYIRAKSLKHNWLYFRPNEKYHLDLYYALRGKVALSRKSLANMTKFLNISGKTSLGDYWQNFVYGDYSKETLNELEKHNYEDCKILEELHKKYEPYVKFNRNYL